MGHGLAPQSHPPVRPMIQAPFACVMYPHIVQAIKSRMQEEKEAAWRALASSGQARPRTEVCVPYKFKATSSTKLGAWEMAELKKLFKGRDANKSGMLSREDLVAAVKVRLLP